ncbi:MAG: DinB family protein [Chitinophagaceae bacterium]|jgi:hypothetical protein
MEPHQTKGFIPEKPKMEHYNPYFGRYINLAFEHPEESLSENGQQLVRLFLGIPENKREYRYAADKWTPKEMLMHLIDTERVFAYRALTCLRNDKTELPSMDENHFAANVKVGHRTLEDLCEEFGQVRNATILLFENASEEQCAFVGNAAGYPITASAVYYMLIGHFYHHKKVMEDKYLANQ